MGGGADLAPSTTTRLTFDDAGDFEAGSYHGRNFHFGIREHAMCAMANGMSLVKVRPFASTFLIFTDYARGAIRLSALMEIPVIYIWTHDSISVGEDGPTHQPIEQLASLRAPPQVRARVTVEESSTYGWHRHAGTHGAILGMETFGASAPIQQIQAKFGFEPGHVIGQGPAGPLPPGMSHVPALSARHQKEGRMP